MEATASDQTDLDEALRSEQTSWKPGSRNIVGRRDDYPRPYGWNKHSRLMTRDPTLKGIMLQLLHDMGMTQASTLAPVRQAVRNLKNARAHLFWTWKVFQLPSLLAPATAPHASLAGGAGSSQVPLSNSSQPTKESPGPFGCPF